MDAVGVQRSRPVGKVTFHGYKDSFLEKFAATCGYKFVELTECDIQGHKTVEVAEVPLPISKRRGV